MAPETEKSPMEEQQDRLAQKRDYLFSLQASKVDAERQKSEELAQIALDTEEAILDAQITAAEKAADPDVLEAGAKSNFDQARQALAAVTGNSENVTVESNPPGQVGTGTVSSPPQETGQNNEDGGQ